MNVKIISSVLFFYFIFFCQLLQAKVTFEDKLEQLIEKVSDGFFAVENLWDFLTCKRLREEKGTQYRLDSKRGPNQNELNLMIRAFFLLHERKGANFIDLTDLEDLQRESGDYSSNYKNQIGYYYLIMKEIERKITKKEHNIEEMQNYLSIFTSITAKQRSFFQNHIKNILNSSSNLIQPTLLSDQEKRAAKDFVNTYLGIDNQKFGAQKKLKDFSEYEEKVISDLPPTKKVISDEKVSLKTPYATFYNLDGYIYDEEADERAKLSYFDRKSNYGQFSNVTKTLRSLQNVYEDPIGYSISMPIDQSFNLKNVKGLIVHVYGGGNHFANTAGFAVFQPGAVSSEDHYLMSKGYAVATLNLPDLLVVDDSLQQHEIDRDLFYRIIGGIYSFYEVVSKEPEKLHRALAPLKGVKKYLMGTSFGGGITMRFAQLHPETFDGYISINGGLKASIKENTWLDATRFEYIKDMKKPMLIFQNYDDTRVLTKKHALPFITNALNAGKGDLLHVYFPREGEEEEGNLHGHFLSKKQGVYNKNVRAILDFIDNASSSKELPRLSAKRRKWVDRGLFAERQYGESGNQQFHDDLDVYSYFLAEALLAFAQFPKSVRDQLKCSGYNLDKHWEKYFKPIWYRSYIISMFPRYSMREYFFQEVFDKLYPSNDNKRIRGAIAGKTAKNFLPPFIEYLKKKYPPRQDLKNVDITKLSRSEDVQDWVWNNREFLLPEMLKGNPEILENLITSKFLKNVGVEGSIRNSNFGKFIIYAQDIEHLELFHNIDPLNAGTAAELKKLLRQEIIKYDSLKD